MRKLAPRRVRAQYKRPGAVSCETPAQNSAPQRCCTSADRPLIGEHQLLTLQLRRGLHNDTRGGAAGSQNGAARAEYYPSGMRAPRDTPTARRVDVPRARCDAATLRAARGARRRCARRRVIICEFFTPRAREMFGEWAARLSRVAGR